MENKLVFKSADLHDAKAHTINAGAALMHAIMKLERMRVAESDPEMEQVWKAYNNFTEEAVGIFDIIVPVEPPDSHTISLETIIFDAFSEALKSIMNYNEGDASWHLLGKMSGKSLHESFKSVKDLASLSDYTNARFCSMNIETSNENVYREVDVEEKYKYKIMFKLLLLNSLHAVAELPIHERKISVTLNDEGFTIENTFNTMKPRIRKGSAFALSILQGQLGLTVEELKGDGLFKLILTFPKE